MLIAPAFSTQTHTHNPHHLLGLGLDPQNVLAGRWGWVTEVSPSLGQVPPPASKAAGPFNMHCRAKSI